MELLTPDFGLFFWSALVFLVLLFLLSKFAWGPIMAGLREREDDIEKSLKAAQEARDQIAQMTSQNEKLLAEARSKREEMLRDAQKQATDLLDKAKAEAEKQAGISLAAAQAAIETQRAAAVAEIKNIAADMSIAIAEKVIKKQMSADGAQQELVKTLLADYGVN
jgi:F-type H+-transporting ATPase subunit b